MKTSMTVCLMAGLLAVTASAEPKLKKEKLQIVFLMGQSNMVGLADMSTARYLTEDPYVAPREIIAQKSPTFDWSNLYWQGIRTFKGPQKYKDQLNGLYEERALSRMKWRQRVNGTRGPWKEEWGKKPEGKGRGVMYPYLDKKAEEEGIYQRMDEIIGSPENKFTMDVAYKEIINREKEIADEVAMVRSFYLGDAKTEDFDAFEAALKEADFSKKPTENVEDARAKYAQLAQKHFNLPIAKDTRIFAHGHVTGSEGEKNQYTTYGPLSVGYGGGITTIGPEYGVGMALDRMVDGPVLLVKCSWGNTAIKEAWRPPSLDGVETPAEKAQREAWNESEVERAKQEGREPKITPAPTKSEKLSYCWGMTLPQIDLVLADPGKFHPDYDPEVGYEVAGMVWFQGYSDQGNQAYGEQLVELIKFMRNKVNTPDMPFVAATLGMPAYKHMALEGDVNGGMVYASRHADMKGTVDVVNTAPYFPLELDLAYTVRDSAEKDSPEYEKAISVLKVASSNKGFHYHGSAKCFLLMGDAMGRSLVNLMAGGEPMIHEQLKAQGE